ncbi:pentapeptide repeat-containing protein [Streptomyces longwoodensis]|uniref:pentapeptide repeat-containing protein n=1 Tax=Streptomyces longwoodensis TaxID=68231 RepID=UPI0033E83FB9
MLALTFTVAVLVAAAVFYTGWDLLGARGIKPEPRIDSKTLFDLVKLSFGVIAGSGALVALVVAYRRQQIDEDGALREATRLHTERFATAVGQIGHDSAAVRLGGVHALAGLADDAPTRDLRQTCIDVLCAYLRLPYTAETDLPAGDAEARRNYLAMREVQHTVIRLIRDRLRQPFDHKHSWQGHDFDFTGAAFDGGNFVGAVFSGGSVSFASARLSGRVSFNGARFSGGNVDFSSAQIDGTVSFDNAKFSSSSVSFDRTEFLQGCDVWLAPAQYSGGSLIFTGTRFSGGTVTFRSSRFDGSSLHFVGVEFSGGTLDFLNAEFSSGSVIFDRTEFSSDAVSFSGANFAGSTVDLRRASGAAPSGLVPLNGAPLPTGVLLPSEWHPAAS